VLDSFADDYRLGIVTNGSPEAQRPKLARSTVDDYVETVVFAGYDTDPKPETEPFDRALATLDSTAERAVHVGNSLASDVAGANAAGLTSVWIPAYEETVSVEPQYRVDTLHGLVDRPWV
jgi:putative hydrolase of the HAD superfamily